MRNLFVLPILCLIAACSVFRGGETYSSQLQQWIGHSEYQLYQAWGYPMQSFYVTPYEKIVTYVKTSNYGQRNPYDNQLYYQGMDSENGWWDKLFGPPTENQPRNYYCKTTFTVRNSIIVNFSFNGDDCTANN